MLEYFSRIRSPKCSQYWYCPVCNRETVHDAKSSATRRDNVGGLSGYRRIKVCQCCGYTERETFELKCNDLIELQNRYESLEAQNAQQSSMLKEYHDWVKAMPATLATAPHEREK
jgi:hypothetical protein